MKKIKYISAAALVASFAGLAFGGATVNAAQRAAIDASNSTVPITRRITDIPSYRSEIDSVTFTYQIEAVSEQGSPAIYTSPTSTQQTCTFSHVSVAANQEATASGCTFDLAGLQFEEGAIGIKKFKITEIGSSNPTDFPVDDYHSYTVSVIVRRNGYDDAAGWYSAPYAEIIQTVNQPNQNTPYYVDNSNQKVATLEFANKMIEHSHVELTKNVEGAFANLDESFTFNVTVNDPNNSGVTTYHVGNKSCTVGTACANAVTLTNGAAAAIIGQSNGTDELVPGMTITITENGATDYVTSYTYKVENNGTVTTAQSPSGDSKTATDIVILGSDASGNNQNQIEFTNTRDDSILDSLTGVFFNIIPYVALATASIFGVIFIKKSKQ